MNPANPVRSSVSETAPRVGAAGSRVPAVLVVDDEADLRDLVSLTLVRMGLDADGAESLARARELMASRSYSLCLTDMRLPDGSGLDLLREVHSLGGPRVAVITAFASAENAVAALKAGAFDYLTKPVDLDQLRLLVRSALRGAAGGDKALEQDEPAAQGALARLIGDSDTIVQLRAMIVRLGQSMAPVSIFGESGTGKELVARAIHESSTRRDMPFIAVNCGAITESLVEAEFFGYRRGAFTGADRDRDGFFQAAGGGTLFLDEVAELPLGMQVKLLRAIQERRVRKVGATGEDPVDVRIVCATHQDLQKLIAAGRFRQDLFYRLNVIELRVPSLRERVGDISAIADAILHRIAERSGLAAVRLSAPALHALQCHAFPGNVRELENILERAMALASGQELQAQDLQLPDVAPEAPTTETAVTAPPLLAAAQPSAQSTSPSQTAVQEGAPAVGPELDQGVPSDLEEYLAVVERDAILAALARTGHNRTAAAQLLGISFRQMRYRMRRLGLR
ncbi:MAG: sigma-54-dependent Fis family transcriptional regulator [Burkholderiaceae bacterium]|nr:sigma-54-dependent Fis family transcriptional regulator [Burkholderiaceae bacterium]